VRDSTPAAGAEAVLAPGDRELQAWTAAAAGGVRLSPTTERSLLGLAEELQVPPLPQEDGQDG
jgi:LDH2 family malate/lactate/ureidoglycolate dehydrogenase